MKGPSLPSAIMIGAVSVGQGARSPVTAKSQLVLGSEVKGPGCGWGTHVPITHWWGPQTPPGDRSPKTQLRFGQQAFHGTSLHLFDWPDARSGLEDNDSLGHGVRIRVTYSYEARTVIPIALFHSNVTPTRGK